MGIGYITAIDAKEADKAMNIPTELGKRVYKTGVCRTGEKGVELTW